MGQRDVSIVPSVDWCENNVTLSNSYLEGIHHFFLSHKHPTSVLHVCSGGDNFQYFSRTVMHSRSYLSGAGAA